MKIRLISLVVVFAGWWFASLFTGPLVLPSPFTVVGRFATLMSEGDLAQALVLGLSALAIGGGAAIVIGIFVGIMLGVQRVLGRAFDFYFSALYVMPFSAVAPLFVLWFGIDITARVAFIFFFTLPQVVIVCYQGARNTPTELIQVARSFLASRREIFFKTILPHEVPFIFTAIRLGLGRAIQGMVVAELLISAVQGFGFLIQRYSAVLDLGAVLAVVLFLMLLGILASYLVERVERAVVPWREESGSGAQGNG